MVLACHNVQLLAKEASTTSPAKLSVLRSCNNLLKRLSKSQDLQVVGCRVEL